MKEKTPDGAGKGGGQVSTFFRDLDVVGSSFPLSEAENEL